MEIPFIIRPMTLEDLPEVMEIEKASFKMPWSQSAYQYELTRNDRSFYLVVRLKAEEGEGPLIAYGGFWFLVGEAHICTLAVKPEWRGRGIGELTLYSLINLALRLGAELATLEVRVSNKAAQNLYRKYGFEVVGRRKGYYSDGEDALIMTVFDINTPKYRSLLAKNRENLERRLREESHG
ncbi:MAG: ribosomal protein S18-alanine N-acetyltransferase [Anaerolineae bacterium]|nr:ribosomal protein S18-alanine N-acetyltransferase [Anaerolineae bacterium]MDW8101377.1 ribosomal protein S18-alanine N-acetyltransferase [Anaerolineae bacterium]